MLAQLFTDPNNLITYGGVFSGVILIAVICIVLLRTNTFSLYGILYIFLGFLLISVSQWSNISITANIEQQNVNIALIKQVQDLSRDTDKNANAIKTIKETLTEIGQKNEAIIPEASLNNIQNIPTIDSKRLINNSLELKNFLPESKIKY
jgi:F420-0:gamma-glutamyl ligase-like protein